MRNPLAYIKKNKNTTNFMIFNVASSNMYANVLRIIGGFVTAYFVTPKELGEFNAFLLIIAYFPIFQIGIPNALGRQLPLYIGRGDTETAVKNVQTAQFWELLLGIVSGLAFLIMSIYNLFVGNFVNVWGYGCLSISTFATFYGRNFLAILYRTNHDFNKLARNALINSTFSFALISIVWLWGFEGLCIRAVLTAILELVLLWLWRPMKTKPKFYKTYFVDLIKVGVPIFIVGLAVAYWTNINNTIILKLGGAESYGFYSLAIAVVSSLTILGTSVTEVLYPKMSQGYGAGMTVKEMMKLPRKPVLINLFLCVPVIIMIWLVLPWIVPILLPKYVGGIEAAQYAAFLIIPSVLNCYNLVFNVTKRQMDYMISVLIGIAINVIVALGLYKTFGFSLKLFPLALFVGKMTQLVVMYLFVRKYIKKGIKDVV